MGYNKCSLNKCYYGLLITVNSQVEMEMRLAKMACTILLVWFLAWTPYAIMSFWIMFFGADGLTPALGVIPTICTKGSALSNAMLYGVRYQNKI